MGKEWEAQIRGARLGMAALAVLAAVTVIAVALMVGSHARSVMDETPASQGSGAPAGALGYEPAE